MFEDLIADLYARLYEINMPNLVEQATDETYTPTTPVPASETPPPRGRSITRRDIQKRADIIVNTKLATRAVVSKTPAGAENESSGTTLAGSGAAAGAVSALHDKGSVGRKDDGGEQTGDEEEMSEMEETKIGGEGASLLFPAY
ncbi:hypothetical protein N7535_003945 [Penicillium sp. DV-2018c]|nr:hypothetical protein N7461_000354 [Penicillium sp. DV-2018c]KAJ5577019.1 hypothetical protein N7535_003945 [Penicillium sp. DV-2018c]